LTQVNISRPTLSSINIICLSSTYQFETNRRAKTHKFENWNSRTLNRQELIDESKVGKYKAGLKLLSQLTQVSVVQ